MKTVKWQEIEWSDDLAVEIIDIDQDHKHLVKHMDALFKACHAGLSAEVIKMLLFQLYRYTREHFAHEEDVMRRQRFPGVEDHRAKHAELIEALDDLIESFEIDPNRQLTEQTLDFLRDWLLHHIMVDDKKIAHHIGAVF